jgi:DNA-binding NarL/FixJ family response regulator
VDASTGRFAVDPDRLGEALRRAARGAAAEQGQSAALAGLSAREREILGLLTEGLDNRAIAAHLHLSSHTVRTHVTNIMRKLGVGSRAEAARLALRAGSGGASVSVIRIEGPSLEER